jgi:hypothetical protein
MDKETLLFWEETYNLGRTEQRGIKGSFAKGLPKGWAEFKQRIDVVGADHLSAVLFEGEEPVLVSEVEKERFYTIKLMRLDEAERMRKKLYKRRATEKKRKITEGLGEKREEDEEQEKLEEKAFRFVAENAQ